MEERLNALVSAIKAEAPELYLGNVPELISVWELRLAAETLCDHIGDQRDNVCPASAYPELVAIVEELGLDRRYFANIRPG